MEAQDLRSTLSELLLPYNDSTTEYSLHMTINLSEINVKLTSSSPGGDETPLWQKLFDISLLIMCGAGFMDNACKIITLTVNGKVFSPIMLALLRHLSVMDAMACLLAVI